MMRLQILPSSAQRSAWSITRLLRTPPRGTLHSSFVSPRSFISSPCRSAKSRMPGSSWTRSHSPSCRLRKCRRPWNDQFNRPGCWDLPRSLSVNQHSLRLRTMVLAAWTMLSDTVLAFVDDGALSRGAAIAFYTVTSIAPILLIVIAIADSVFGREAAQGAIIGQLSGLMGQQTADVLQTGDRERLRQIIGHSRNDRRLGHPDGDGVGRVRRNADGAECHLEGRAQGLDRIASRSRAGGKPWPGRRAWFHANRIAGGEHRPDGVGQLTSIPFCRLAK